MSLTLFLTLQLLLSNCLASTHAPHGESRSSTFFYNNMTLNVSKTLISSSVASITKSRESSRNISLTSASDHENSTKTSVFPNKCAGQRSSYSAIATSPIRWDSSLLSDKGLSEQCVLWDDCCCGNITRATDIFFNYTLPKAQQCFRNMKTQSAKGMCDAWREDRHHQSKMQSWMRGSQCVTTASSWGKLHHKALPTGIVDVAWDTCCGACFQKGRNKVDIFYWPTPEADDSCLSIIHDTADPIDMGATVKTKSPSHRVTYWACTLRTPKAGASLAMTARLDTIDHITFKASLINPWDPPDCVGVSTRATHLQRVKPTFSSVSSAFTGFNFSKIQPTTTKFNPEPPVTAVLSGYTL